jgi:hypothetical protein
MALHLYGIVRAGQPLPQRPGVGDTGAPLEAVDAGDVAVVMSEVPDSYQLTDDDAVRHLDVLTALVADGPVLPMPLGTTAPDADDVRDGVLSDASAQDLRRRLAALADVVEVHLDVHFDDALDLPALMAEEPEVRALAATARAQGAGMEQQMQLGETIARLLQARRARLAEAVVAELTPHAERTARLPASREGMDRWAFLVRRDRLDDMDAGVAGARERHADEVSGFDYVGPLPAYSFLDLVDQPSETGAESRWGW